MKEWGLNKWGALPRVIAGLLQSLGFETGVTGWRIQTDGTAEFQALTVASAVGVDHGALGGLGDDDHAHYGKERLSGGLAVDVPTHAHSGATEAGTVDHGALDGLADDDHAQYLKEKGSGLAAEIPVHDHSAAAEAGLVHHGDLNGLGDDDHMQYLKEKGSGLAAEIPLHDHSAAAQAGTVDHGVLDGLADDDHTQYLKERDSGGLAAEIPVHGHVGRLGGGKLLWVFDGESLHVHSYPAAWTEVNVDHSNYRATTYGAPNVELMVDEYLSVADAAWQESGTEEFLVWGWCYLESLAGTNTIAAKWAGSGTRSWRLDYGGADVYFRFTADAVGTGADKVILSSTKGLLLNRWFFVAGYLEPGELMRIFVGRHDETALTADSLTTGVPAGLHDGAGALCIGATSTPASHHEGRIGRVMARANVPSASVAAHVEMLFAASRPFYNEVETEYILRARFATWDQGYADAQVVDTEGEGIQDGTLTVVEVDGTLAVVSGRCAFTAQATPAWGDLGFYSQGITRALGDALRGTINLTTWEEMGVGWHSAGAVVDPDSMEHGVQAHATDGRLDYKAVGAIATGLSTSTDYGLVLVLGGYDSNGVPWHDGAAGTFTQGVAVFIEIGGTYKLLWRDTAGATATLYAAFASLDAAGTLDNFAAPDVDLSAVLQPLVKDTFTNANGTGLDAHVPDVDAQAGGWTEYSGVWEINENHARMTSAAGYYTTSIDSGEADVLVRASLRPGQADGLAAVVVRQTDDANYFDIQIRAQENVVRLLKIEAGGSLLLDSAAVTINADTDYEVTVKCDDETITAWVDGAALVTDSGVTFNKTATRHGLLDYGGRGSLFDDFHIHALRSDTYEDAFEGAT